MAKDSEPRQPVHRRVRRCRCRAGGLRRADGAGEDGVIFMDVAVLVSRDAEGKLTVKENADEVAKGGMVGALGGLVLGLIFPAGVIAATVVGGAAGAGIGGTQSHHREHEIKKEIEDVLPPDYLRHHRDLRRGLGGAGGEGARQGREDRQGQDRQGERRGGQGGGEQGELVRGSVPTVLSLIGAGIGIPPHTTNATPWSVAEGALLLVVYVVAFAIAVVVVAWLDRRLSSRRLFREIYRELGVGRRPP